MFKYRNKMTGREVEFETEQSGLEASDGWERVEEAPAPKAPAREEKIEGSKD